MQNECSSHVDKIASLEESLNQSDLRLQELMSGAQAELTRERKHILDDWNIKRSSNFSASIKVLNLQM